jgi:hypothetical protein
VPYDTDVNVFREGDKNQDFAVLWLKYAHDDQRALEIGNTSSLNEAAQRAGSMSLPPVMAWGIKAGRRKEDPFTTQLTYRRRDEGPTLLFQTAVEFGNSGGPLVFEGKVIGIVSAVQGGETRGTRIQTVYDALRNWNIASVQRETAPTIENARKALVNNDFGTAQRLLTDVWNLQGNREAARLLAKLNLEKFENPLVAADWLTKLEKLGDARASIELALLGLSIDESKDADVRAADEAMQNGVVPRSRIGNRLARLVGQSKTEREALLACVYHDMIEADRSPSCVPRLLWSFSWISGLIGLPKMQHIALPRTPNDVEQKLQTLKEKGDPWVELVAPRKNESVANALSEGLAENLVKAAADGSLHAAMRFLTLSPLASPKELDQLRTVADVIEKAQFSEDQVYVVSEDFFRIIDKLPTRRDLVRAKLLLALAHLIPEKTLANEHERLPQAKRILENVDGLVKAEGRSLSHRQPLPHRLMFLVRALIAEQDENLQQAAQNVIRALLDWNEATYLPVFARDLNLLDTALRIILNVDVKDVQKTLLAQLKDTCRRHHSCWSPLAKRFDLFSSRFGSDGVKAISDSYIQAITDGGEVTGLEEAEPEVVDGAVALAKQLHDYLQASDSQDARIKVLTEIQARLARIGRNAECAGKACKPNWSVVKLTGQSDWTVYDGRNDQGVLVACRASTQEGLFRQFKERRGRKPQLSFVTSEDWSWTRAVIEFDPGFRIADGQEAGENAGVFIVGEHEFKASLRNEGRKSYLLVDSAAPAQGFLRLFGALRGGHNLTVTYRKVGAARESDASLTREHFSLHGFGAAMSALLSNCRPAREFSILELLKARRFTPLPN